MRGTHFPRKGCPSSPVLSPLGLVFLCLCHHGQLYCVAPKRYSARLSQVLLPVRGQGYFRLSCFRGQFSGLLQVARGEEGRGEEGIIPTPKLPVADKCQGQFSHALALGLAHLSPLDQGQHYCAAWVPLLSNSRLVGSPRATFHIDLCSAAAHPPASNT